MLRLSWSRVGTTQLVQQLKVIDPLADQGVGRQSGGRFTGGLTALLATAGQQQDRCCEREQVRAVSMNRR